MVRFAAALTRSCQTALTHGTEYRDEARSQRENQLAEGKDTREGKDDDHSAQARYGGGAVSPSIRRIIAFCNMAFQTETLPPFLHGHLLPTHDKTHGNAAIRNL